MKANLGTPAPLQARIAFTLATPHTSYIVLFEPAIGVVERAFGFVCLIWIIENSGRIRKGVLTQRRQCKIMGKPAIAGANSSSSHQTRPRRTQRRERHPVLSYSLTGPARLLRSIGPSRPIPRQWAFSHFSRPIPLLRQHQAQLCKPMNRQSRCHQTPRCGASDSHSNCSSRATEHAHAWPCLARTHNQSIVGATNALICNHLRGDLEFL